MTMEQHHIRGLETKVAEMADQITAFQAEMAKAGPIPHRLDDFYGTLAMNLYVLRVRVLDLTDVIDKARGV